MGEIKSISSPILPPADPLIHSTNLPKTILPSPFQ